MSYFKSCIIIDDEFLDSKHVTLGEICVKACTEDTIRTVKEKLQPKMPGCHGKFIEVPEKCYFTEGFNLIRRVFDSQVKLVCRLGRALGGMNAQDHLNDYRIFTKLIVD